MHTVQGKHGCWDADACCYLPSALRLEMCNSQESICMWPLLHECCQLRSLTFACCCVRWTGASQQDIDTLPTFTVRDAPRAGGSSGDASEQGCSICLEDVQSGALMRVLPCTHKFHKTCIDSWLKQRATCPICQKSI